MGFFDSFNKSLNKEKNSFDRERERSSYKTVKTRTAEHEHRFDRCSSTELISKYNSFVTSEEDKIDIERILVQRGYKKINGSFHRI